METNNNEKNKIIGSCNTCRTPIYENEAVYDFTVDRSSNQSSNYKDGNPAPNDQIIETTGHSENWKQCAWCYDQ
jgi:hypothetical protein